MSFLSEEVYARPVFAAYEPMAVLSGTDCYDFPIEAVPLHDMHLMVVGASGMGKTVQIMKVLEQTVQNPNSTHIIFDPKGDFCRKYYRDGIDYVLSLHDLPGVGCRARWSLMRDVASDPHPESAIREITKTLCKEAVDGNSANPFFPEAAESLMAAVWTMVFRKYKNNLPDNHTLIDFTRNITYDRLLKEASKKDASGRMINGDVLPTIRHLLDPGGGITTANIKQEMERILTQAFDPMGNFCSDGTFSVRQFVRNGKGRRLFLVYDFAAAESACQIFSLLLNLMMKESLAVASGDENDRIYYYLDEMPVLPDHLTYLENLCNFGRSSGNRVIMGLQGLTQLYERYGRDGGDSIVSAFTDNIIMKTNDPVTVEKLARRSGQVQKTRSSMGVTRDSVATKMDFTDRIPEDVIANLGVGQAVVALRGTAPFYIALDP